MGWLQGKGKAVVGQRCVQAFQINKLTTAGRKIREKRLKRIRLYRHDPPFLEINSIHLAHLRLQRVET
jgi:hypothetical protein